MIVQQPMQLQLFSAQPVCQLVHNIHRYSLRLLGTSWSARSRRRVASSAQQQRAFQTLDILMILYRTALHSATTFAHDICIQLCTFKR